MMRRERLRIQKAMALFMAVLLTFGCSAVVGEAPVGAAEYVQSELPAIQSDFDTMVEQTAFADQDDMGTNLLTDAEMPEADEDTEEQETDLIEMESEEETEDWTITEDLLTESDSFETSEELEDPMATESEDDWTETEPTEAVKISEDPISTDLEEWTETELIEASEVPEEPMVMEPEDDWTETEPTEAVEAFEDPINTEPEEWTEAEPTEAVEAFEDPISTEPADWTETEPIEASEVPEEPVTTEPEADPETELVEENEVPEEPVATEPEADPETELVEENDVPEEPVATESEADPETEPVEENEVPEEPVATEPEADPETELIEENEVPEEPVATEPEADPETELVEENDVLEEAVTTEPETDSETGLVEAAEAEPIEGAEAAENPVITEPTEEDSDLTDPVDTETEIPVEGQVEAADTASSPNYMIVVVGDTQTTPDPSSSAGCGSITFETGDGLTAIVKGISDDNREQLQTLINDNGWQTLDNGNVLEIHMPTLLDVEKYSTVSGPYDQDLCWAAAASNLLWGSGYAQDAVNPATNAPFANADEVFDYFRQIFTDNGGLVDGAVSVFMTGEYPYDSEWYTENDWSQLKEENVEGLLPETDPLEVGEEIQMQGSPEKIQVLELLDRFSVSLALRRITDDSVAPDSWNWDDAYGHAVTAVGLVYDAMVTNIRERYKAIFLADSDNTPCNGSEQASDSDKAEAAASAPNTYTMYGLSLVDFGDQYGPLWVIDNYPGTLANGMGHVAIREMFALRDNGFVEPETPEQPAQPETHDTATPSDTASDSQSTNEPSVTAPVNSMYAKIKQLMKENDWLVYSPADWHQPCGQEMDFEIYFHASLTFLEQITMDGEPLTYRDYSIKNCRNGLFLLTLDGSRMEQLEQGEHTLIVQLRKSGEITMRIFVD